MDPVVQRLASMGYPVRKVNIDHDQALASQYRVQGVPCFVLVVDGNEAERTVGATSHEQLVAMFQRHGVTAASASPAKPEGGSSEIEAIRANGCGR